MHRIIGTARRLIATVAVATLAVTAPVQAAAPTPAVQAAEWLIDQQRANGSFPGFGTGSTVDAVLGLEALGYDTTTVISTTASPIDFLATQAITYTGRTETRVGGTGKLLMAVSAVQAPPRSFGGVDLIDKLTKTYDAATGKYGATSGPLDQAYAVLGLKASSQFIPQNAITALTGTQLADGGWSYDGSAEGGSDTNTTAVVLQALAAVGQSRSTAATSGANYLIGLQTADGGFPFAAGSESDPNSTAYVIQGLVAVGRDPLALKKGSNDPLTALRSFQNASGSFRSIYANPDAAATIQALPALDLKVFPVQVTIRLFVPIVARSA